MCIRDSHQLGQGVHRFLFVLAFSGKNGPLSLGQTQRHEHDNGLGVVLVLLTHTLKLDAGLKGSGQPHEIRGWAGMEPGFVDDDDLSAIHADYSLLSPAPQRR